MKKFLLKVGVFCWLKIKETILNPEVYKVIGKILGWILLAIGVMIGLWGIFTSAGWLLHDVINGEDWIKDFDGTWDLGCYFALGVNLFAVFIFGGSIGICFIFLICVGIYELFKWLFKFIKSNWKEADEIVKKYLEEE